MLKFHFGFIKYRLLYIGVLSLVGLLVLSQSRIDGNEGTSSGFAITFIENFASLYLEPIPRFHVLSMSNFDSGTLEQ